MRAIELFCGIGGFRLALDRLGVKTVLANDIDPRACAVYAAHFGGTELVRGDVRTLSADDIPDHDILVGGFPCKSFSPAGRKAGVDDQVNGTLFKEIVRILAARRPQFFALENVRRLLTMDRGRHFSEVLQHLARLGYVVEWHLVNATSFGLPQNRQRVMIVGRLDDGGVLTPRLADVPAPQRNTLRPYKDAAPFRFWGIATATGTFDASVPDNLGFIPPGTLRDVLQSPNEISADLDYTGRMTERLADSTQIGRHYNGVEILYNQGGGARFGYTIYGPDGLAPTLTASTSRHFERYLIDGCFRRLTDVEYARLMGFPDNWAAVLPRRSRYVVYGNAVAPPCVEWAIGRLVGAHAVRAAA